MSGLTLAQSIRQRQLLELSDERDQWRQLMLEMARESYIAGYADGQADERHEHDRVWAARLPVPFPLGPTFAELEELRGDTARSAARAS